MEYTCKDCDYVEYCRQFGNEPCKNFRLRRDLKKKEDSKMGCPCDTCRNVGICKYVGRMRGVCEMLNENGDDDINKLLVISCVTKMNYVPVDFGPFCACDGKEHS